MDAAALVEEAFKARKIGPRQHRAMMKHAGNHSPDHIQRMLDLMTHKTFREAHRMATKEVGK